MKNQKKWTRFFTAVLVCLLFLQAPVFQTSVSAASASQTSTVKNGLKKINGKYYYYKNGKKLTNTWKTVKVNGTSYRYYFSKTGAAYAGSAEGLALKKIGGKYYAFNRYGRMVTGVQVIPYTYTADGISMVGLRFYYFNEKTGAYNSSVSKKLRKAAVYEKSSKTLRRLLKTYAGEAVKTESVEGCYGNGIETLVYYKTFIVDYGNTAEGKEVFLGCMAR